MTAETTRELGVVTPRGVARRFDPDALVAAWREHLEELVAAGEMAKTTATTYEVAMRRFLGFVGERDAGRIGPALLREWKAAQLAAGAKPASVNVRFAGVRHFFGWAVGEQALAYDPTAGVKGARRGQGRRHQRDPLSDVEVIRVLAQPDGTTATGTRDRAILHLLAYTGARSVEVVRATVGDLHTNGSMWLAVTGKGRIEADERLYLVHPDLVAAIYDWLAIHPRGGDPSAPLFCGLGNRNTGGALALSTLRALVKGYYLAAGIRDPRKTTHSMRHSFVSNLIRHGVAPVSIMAATRHKSLDTLMVYAGEAQRDKDPAEGHVNYAAMPT